MPTTGYGWSRRQPSEEVRQRPIPKRWETTERGETGREAIDRILRFSEKMRQTWGAER